MRANAQDSLGCCEGARPERGVQEAEKVLKKTLFGDVPDLNTTRLLKSQRIG